MAFMNAIKRGEAVLTLLRRLRRRPILPRPEGEEAEGELRARIDTPGHAAALDEEQYNSILRGDRVAWKSVLAFLTQDPDGAATRAYWIDPLRLTSYGCLLDADDLEALAPLFGLAAQISASRAVPLDQDRIELSLYELDIGAHFRLIDGRIGEVLERYGPIPGRITVRMEPGTEDATVVALPDCTVVRPATEEEARGSARAIRRRGRLTLARPPD